MKTTLPSIAIINSLINLKAQNGNKNFNLYKWLKDAKAVYHPGVNLKQFACRIAFAGMTEKSCLDKCSF